MRTLSVSNFSCIRDATIEIGRLTLLIGPQASGKSVLCKLNYFLIECSYLQYVHLSKQSSFEKYVDSIKERFLEWFPLAAWGKEQFRITFVAGDYSVSLVRKKWGGRCSNDFRVKFSEPFMAQYESLLEDAVKSSADLTREADLFGAEYRFREISEKSLRKIMGRDYTAYQAFVPAGRSFFTSIGKAIAAFEQGRVLDPLILRFGRLYTTMRERAFYGPKENQSLKKIIEKSFETLLGGKVERDGEKEFMHASDGRKIPLSAMSSGQQELLPLITFMPWLLRTEGRRLCYIEEPEAHLFPTAQSALIETLAMATSSISQVAAESNLVITTHSPYVMTKVNNLLKAGAIGRSASEDKRRKLETIVPRRAWLQARSVRAYAIKGGVVSSILEADGLINSDYLDEVSGELGQEFDRLLEVEHEREL